MYDPIERLSSDGFFLNNEAEIKKHLGIDQDDQAETDDELDIDHGIDFIYKRKLISYKTIYQKYKTFTFRIPPSAPTELSKLTRVYGTLWPQYELIVVVANIPLGMLFWVDFGDILAVPDHLIIDKPVRVRGDGTRMHIIHHDYIVGHRGVVHSAPMDYS